ncbi:Hypothetical predicted protein [Olea europaea subsp. europaea]|uniref:Uncharacterized protein n=1 Tax=Olea europaea subsp. europaea TaxID=158383 RepID=A0A8S0SAN1_OLEEU|nr:Hypothetical predicted protein [Olea europaea subsp. europaea]
MEINEIFGDSQRENVLTKSAIYVWGYNQSGQTCRRGKEQGPEAVSAGVFLLSRRHKFQWLHIACGCEHTTATAFDGSLFTWDNKAKGRENGSKAYKNMELVTKLHNGRKLKDLGL